jgi:hypothetical protein
MAMSKSWPPEVKWGLNTTNHLYIIVLESFHLLMQWFLGSKVLSFRARFTIPHIWINQWVKTIPIELAKCTRHCTRHWNSKMADDLVNFGSKGQRSSIIDNEIGLFFSSRVNISFIWTSYRMRMISIDFGVKRWSIPDNEMTKWFSSSKVLF